MDFIVDIYNKIWIFILKVIKEAGINFDVTKVPEWLNVPSLEEEAE